MLTRLRGNTTAGGQWRVRPKLNAVGKGWCYYPAGETETKGKIMNKKMMLLLSAIALTGCAVNADSDRSAVAQQTKVCTPINEVAVAELFERWNSSLQTGIPRTVVNNYAERSILLPTLSGVNRITRAEKEDYFKHFLESKPQGAVTSRQIDIGCNMAVDSGMYTFRMGATGATVRARYTFTYKWAGQDWLISSHHSSLLPTD